MALRDTLRNLIGIPENDYDSEYDDDMQAGNVEQEEEEQMPSPSLSSDRKHNKVVNIHATTQLAVVLVKPERYEDAASIADHLNAKKTVVLNLEQTSKDVSRRLIDFLCGVAYANNGQMKRVANNTYIITPYNVDIMGDLLDELENELGIETYACNWPMGSGREFQGVYDRRSSQLIFFSGVSGKKRADKMEIDLYDPQVADLIGERRHQQLIDDVELLGAGREFDLDEVRAGRLSPVFFGSALTNFGVEPFLEEFLRMTPSPLPREADCGVIDTFSPDFSAFVFKIQANMNKAHRDRLAFMRICSGQFQRDAEYYHVQTGKKMRLSQPQQLMASEREIVDEAYAGDIIGVFDPGIFSIGDTITVPGKKFKFGGIPTFAPEHFARVSAKDSMKRKQFLKGMEQIAQEGAIQIFKLPGAGLEEVIVGVVGTLQFDVFQYRMRSEYGVELYMEGLPYEHLRVITACPCKPEDLVLCTGAALLEDFKGRLLVAFGGEWSVGFLTKHNPGLELAESLSV